MQIPQEAISSYTFQTTNGKEKNRYEISRLSKNGLWIATKNIHSGIGYFIFNNGKLEIKHGIILHELAADCPQHPIFFKTAEEAYAVVKPIMDDEINNVKSWEKA
tara:strand:+ start:9917 stop:10231 length:315 start_codon:yes stop_codon:yes gene_type:complete